MLDVEKVREEFHETIEILHLRLEDLEEKDPMFRALESF